MAEVIELCLSCLCLLEACELFDNDILYQTRLGKRDTERERERENKEKVPKTQKRNSLKPREIEEGCR